MIKNASEFTLIEGIFLPNEAKFLLSSLISSKIQFHSLDGFSSKIRFNDDNSKSKARVEALTKTREDIFYLLELAEKNNLNIVLDSKIVIRFEQKPT